MDRLKELLQGLWMKVVEALKGFENSALFERIMRRYESMTPRGQNVFKALLKIGTLCMIAVVILGGPFLLLSKLNKIKTLERLEGNAVIFQAEYEAQTRGYTPPSGWKPLAAESASALASAFNDYLPGIGVPEEFGTLQASGETLSLTLKEVSIRQATNILFQLEGLYPKVRTQTLNIRPNAGQRDILDMEATFQFNPAFASQVAVPNMDADEDEGYVPPPTTNNNIKPGTPPTTNRGEGGTDANSDFQNDYVPPPPPGGQDYDDMTPPDIPDDLPPPPPPPGFEEEP